MAEQHVGHGLQEATGRAVNLFQDGDKYVVRDAKTAAVLAAAERFIDLKGFAFHQGSGVPGAAPKAKKAGARPEPVEA